MTMLGLFVLSCTVVFDSATPWTVAHQAPLSMEFSRQEYRCGLPFPSPGNLPDPGIDLPDPGIDLPDPGIEPGSPALQADTLPSELPGNPWKRMIT